MKKKQKATTIIGGAAVATALAILVKGLFPDFKRYLRIRTM
ncbi:DUF6893 family small protein [Streptomyces sp. NPDC054841]